MDLKSFHDLPGPWGMPVLGSLPSLTNRKEEVLQNWAENIYGPVFRLRMGVHEVIALQGFEAIKEALGKGESFSGRVESNVMDNARGNKGLFFLNYGPAWKTWRSFATQQLAAVSNTSLKGILGESDHFKTFLQNNIGNPINLFEALKVFMMNAVLQTCFSKRLDILDPKAEELYSTVYGSVHSPKFVQLLCLPWLRYIPKYKTFLNDLNSEREQIIKLISSLVEERRNEDRLTPDLVTCFYQMQQQNPDESAENLVMFIEDLLFAGSATTAYQFLWVVLLLLKHPQCLAKLVAELDESLSGKENAAQSITGENAPDMNYLKAVLQEAFRLRPIAPCALLHATSEDTSVMGYAVPKGVAVLPNIWSVHQDKDHWKPDPEVFRPERHLDQSGNFVKSDWVMNFSTGWRQCVGRKLAETEIMVHLVTLLAHFDIKLAEESRDIDMSGVSEALLKPYPFKVVLGVRNQSQ